MDSFTMICKFYCVWEVSIPSDTRKCLLNFLRDAHLVLFAHHHSDWIGSGEEATVEQQTEIPPITAMETPSGAAEGAEVTTIYKTTTTTTQAPEAPPEAADEQTVPAPTTDTPVTVTTTTVTTTTVLVELDPVEFDSAPIDVMGTAIVVEGSTVDDVVSGNATVSLSSLLQAVMFVCLFIDGPKNSSGCYSVLSI